MVRTKVTFETPRNFKVILFFPNVLDRIAEVRSPPFLGSLGRPSLLWTVVATISSHRSDSDGLYQFFREKIKEIYLNCSSQIQLERVAINDVDATYKHSNPFENIVPTPTEEGTSSKKDSSKRRDLKYFSECHYKAATLADPEFGGGQLKINILPDMMLEEGGAGFKAFKVSIDFMVDKPKAGIVFYAPKLSYGKQGSGDQDYGTGMNEELNERGFQLYTYRSTCHGSCSSSWFPCVDAFNELCLWKIEITTDANMTAVASGDLQETVYTQDMACKTFHYTLNVPTSAANIGLAVAPFQISVHPEMTELTNFCPPGLMSLLKYTTKDLDTMCEFFEELLNTRLPYGSYKQVFVVGASEEVVSYASMSILSLSTLYHKGILDTVALSRSQLAHAIASQFFGCFVNQAHWLDTWLVKGISRYVTGLYMERFFGNNEYRFHLYRTMTQVSDYESVWGAITLRPQPNEDIMANRGLHFDPRSSLTTSPLYIDILIKKSHLVIRLLEKKLGKELLFQVLSKVLSLAIVGKEERGNPGTWTNLLLSTDSFFNTVSNLSPLNLTTFYQMFIYGSGHAHFAVTTAFNRKKNVVELEIKQDPMERGRMKYVGPIAVRMQECDGSFTHTLQIDDSFSRHEISCHSKARKQRKRKIPLFTQEEVDMDLSLSDADSPVLWIQLDPDLLLIRRTDIKQPEFHWLYQLKHEKDVVAQFQALEAAMALAEVSNKLGNQWSGFPLMLNLWRKYFATQSSPNIPKPNNFSNFQLYFLMQAIPSAMSKLHFAGDGVFGDSNDAAAAGGGGNAGGAGVGGNGGDVVRFLLDIYRLNYNKNNKYTDDFYRAGIILSLANASQVPPMNAMPSSSSSTGTNQMEAYRKLPPLATCDGPTKPAIFPKEIIEFPCLKVNSRTMEVESQFHRYVRPLHNPTLSDHCVELTGIIQEMIDEQPEFLSVLCDFNQWMVDEELYVPKRQNSESKGGHDKPKYSSVFCTFGDWDLNVMIPEQCALTGVMTPTYFNRWANIKKTMSSTLKQWPHSFAQMLDKLNLTHEGRAHSGMDDCRNTVNALRQLIVTHGGQVKITTIRNLKHGAAGNSTAPSASVQSNDAENELVMIKKSARYIE